MQCRHLVLLSCTCTIFGAAHDSSFSKVIYDPSLTGLELISTDSEKESGRRLADTKTIIAYNPDRFQVWEDKTTIHILAADFEMTDFLYKSHLDLVVKAAEVTLPAKMIFAASTTGKKRTVKISARTIKIPLGGSVLDVSGSTVVDAILAAENSLNRNKGGAAGTDGAHGAEGEPGGDVFIDAGIIVGGNLTIKSNGGTGKNGQDGEDGNLGDRGEDNGDVFACCNGRVMHGFDGQDGGRGGNAGNGGAGGSPGNVLVNLLDTKEDLVTIEANAGLGGSAGLPGFAGHGGVGGLGSPSRCIWTPTGDRGKLCTYPLDENGTDGIDGAAGAAGNDGASGNIIDQVAVSESDLETLRSGACSDPAQLKMEERYADRLYRNSQLVEADFMYYWITSANSSECVGNSDWEVRYTKASMMRQRLAMNRDYWGHVENHAPLLSWESLYSETKILLALAEHVEQAAESYRKQMYEGENQAAVFQSALETNKVQKASEMEALKQLSVQIAEDRKEVDVLKAVVRDLEEQIIGRSELCDLGIKEKARFKTYNAKASMTRMVKFMGKFAPMAFQAALIAMPLVGAGTTLIQTGLTSSLQLLNPLFARGATMTTWTEFITNGAMDNVIQTIQTQVNTIVTPANKTKNQLEDIGIGEALDAGVKEMDDTTRLIGSGAITDDILAFIADIQACVPLVPSMTQLSIEANKLDAKITQHDENVLEWGKLSLKLLDREAEYDRLRNEAVGTFDPTQNSVSRAISESYDDIRDDVIASLRSLQQSMNYEFCQQSAPVWYGDSRVLSLQSQLFDLGTQRITLRNSENRARTLVADVPATWDPNGFDRVAAFDIIIAETADTESVWTAFKQDGTLQYNLQYSDLPVRGMANLRVEGVQVHADLSDTSAEHHVWTSRMGSSECRSVSGSIHTFSHAAHTYVSSYIHSGQQFLTRMDGMRGAEVSQEDSVRPNPIGLWEIKMPFISKEDRLTITQFTMKLMISGVACNDVSLCVGSEESVLSAAALATEGSSLGNLRSLVPFSMLGMVLIVFAVVGAHRGKGQRRSLGGQFEEPEQVEHVELAGVRRIVAHAD